MVGELGAVRRNRLIVWEQFQSQVDCREAYVSTNLPLTQNANQQQAANLLENLQARIGYLRTVIANGEYNDAVPVINRVSDTLRELQPIIDSLLGPNSASFCREAPRGNGGSAGFIFGLIVGAGAMAYLLTR